ncbi:MAG: hypothetical protein KatS3mg002_1502 [Candidatus Woesearchaeota archaeon]|nr:MAG: hypothetical protein KatS3mg002_1502 [Candidatus Woesearchaeota archaeon]
MIVKDNVWKLKGNIWKLNLFLMSLLVLLLLSVDVSALGVAPSKNIIDIDKANLEYTLSIINNDNKDLNLLIIPQGEYAKYVVLDPYVSLSSSEKEKEIKYTLNLPKDLPPGPNKIILLVVELPSKSLNMENNKCSIIIINRAPRNS